MDKKAQRTQRKAVAKTRNCFKTSGREVKKFCSRVACGSHAYGKSGSCDDRFCSKNSARAAATFYRNRSDFFFPSADERIGSKGCEASNPCRRAKDWRFTLIAIP